MLMLYMPALKTDAEREGFAEIYNDVKKPCLKAAFRITQDTICAEDAVHDAFVVIIKDIEKYIALPRDKRRSLIVIIVKNKAIDIMRKAKLRQYIPLEDADESSLNSGLDFLDIIAEKEATQFLLRCVNKLPDIYKTVFELRYVHQMNNCEIAVTLEISETNVSSRIQRARAMLRKLVEQGGENKWT